MQPLVVPIVEGQGETEAVPLLIKRIAQLQQVYPRVNPPTRVKVGSFLNDRDYFSKYISLAAGKAFQGNGLVLIMLDCEDGCPAELGPDLLNRARAVRSDVDYLVALPYREYETWFLAAAMSLRAHRGLPDNLDPPYEPENIRDAKDWLHRRMPTGYDPIIHQASFTDKMDFEAASSISSFRRILERLTTHFINRRDDSQGH